MYRDIVFPNNNEKEFIEMGLKLGCDSLIFAYDLKTFDKNKTKNQTKIKVDFGIISSLNNLKKARNLSKTILIKSSDKNRQAFENTNNIILFCLEENFGKDYIHHRASGLNHILCSLAKKNNIIIGFSFSSILNSHNRPKILGRIKQNIRLCRKYKVETIIASFAKTPYEMRSPYDLISLFSVLGMGSSEVKRSLETFY